MTHWYTRWLPTPETLSRNRWLRWLGPALHHPRLWRMRRRGIALGMAVGLFFGFLIPVAQIPVSAALAVVMRANLPAAVASTLVTNPVTFGPVYYGAYHLGRWLLPSTPATTEAPTDPVSHAAPSSHSGGPRAALHRLEAAGKPLLLGLLVVATVTSLAAYCLVNWLWIVRTRRLRRHRLRQRHTTLP